MTGRVGMADPVRVGQVGLGWFGGMHLQTWEGIDGVEVTGVYDADPDRARALGRTRSQDDFHVAVGNAPPARLPAGATVYDSLDALLDSGITLLDVVAAEPAHAELVRRGLTAGLDVIVEKPLALDAGQARDLVELAASVGRRIYPAHVLRFDPRHLALADLIGAGDLRHLSMHRNFQPSAHDVYGRVHPLHTAMIHDLDLAIWYAGARPDAVTAFASSFLGRTQPDVVDVVLHFAGGLRAVVQNSWHLARGCPYGFEFECKAQTGAGTYLVRNEPDVHVWDGTGATSPDLYFWPHIGGARRGALHDELRHFAGCAAAGRPTDRVPLDQVVWLAETCAAALESIATGSTAKVA